MNKFGFKKQWGPGTDRALSPALLRLRQENHCEFQDSLGPTERFCLRHKIKYLKSMVACGSEAEDLEPRVKTRPCSVVKPIAINIMKSVHCRS